jgi:hypothetical protein
LSLIRGHDDSDEIEIHFWLGRRIAPPRCVSVVKTFCSVPSSSCALSTGLERRRIAPYLKPLKPLNPLNPLNPLP